MHSSEGEKEIHNQGQGKGRLLSEKHGISLGGEMRFQIICSEEKGKLQKGNNGKEQPEYQS